MTSRKQQQLRETIPNWAHEKIDAVRTYGSSSLNLSRFDPQGSKLTDIPKAVFTMTWLETLDLGNNRLLSVPREIGQLQNLKSLFLNGNQLTGLPPEISQLQNLKWLYLYNNLLRQLPSEIGQLRNLEVLHLSGNQLAEVPTWLVDLPKLENLYLFGNPIQTPPQEVLDLRESQPIDLDKLSAYFRQLAQDGDDTLYEAKLIIIGEPGAGKTTLVKKLQDPTYHVDPTEISTEGIDVTEWGFPLPHPPNNSQKLDDSNTLFRINIWDFGGQEIYHATHKFFLTRRSLYALVADAREQKTDFYYWLNVVELLSDNSPALIISNEKQNRAWPFNENQLRGEFKSLKDVFPVNLANNDNRSLDKIIEAIKYHIMQLPHVGQTLPKTWVRVREALEADLRNTMPLHEYLDLCQTHGFTRDDDKLQLSDYLHDLGVCLHYQDDPLLNKTLILKPEWGTTAVYAVLESERIKANWGRFNHADLATIWQEEKYTRWRDELLQLMLRFQLCYPLPTGDYIAPQLLSENRPRYKWKYEDTLHLRFRYPAFMPKGILTRFIVATHRLIADQRGVWKTGVILKDTNALAEIIEHYQRREITVRVAGGQKRELLTKIGYEFEKIHSEFPDRLQIEQLIPCNCSHCRANIVPYFFDFSLLKKRLAAGRATAECEESYETVDVWSLIDDVGARGQVSTDIPRHLKTAGLSSLRQTLLQAFSDDELNDLCFELGLDFTDLPGDTRIDKVRELILWFERRGQLEKLIEYARVQRPHLNWD
ncbi:MAG: leucine-rich repeat domain-containing protein [Ardenticatenaceae bacterium]|nr:leucine-rich repeat domain-containing protein [Ardenticatenaceae bacterium]